MWVYSEDAQDRFTKELDAQAEKAGFDPDTVHGNTMADGTLNFTYEGIQLGRVRFGKRTSAMQVIREPRDQSDLGVDWFSNESLEDYLAKIPLWFDYLKTIKKHESEWLESIGLE